MLTSALRRGRGYILRMSSGGVVGEPLPEKGLKWAVFLTGMIM
jgi:hypothetical protein